MQDTVATQCGSEAGSLLAVQVLQQRMRALAPDSPHILDAVLAATQQLLLSTLPAGPTPTQPPLNASCTPLLATDVLDAPPDSDSAPSMSGSAPTSRPAGGIAADDRTSTGSACAGLGFSAELLLVLEAVLQARVLCYGVAHPASSEAVDIVYRARIHMVRCRLPTALL